MDHDPLSKLLNQSRDIDPVERLKVLYRTAVDLAVTFASFAPAFLYFVLYWQFKDKIRVKLRGGALAFMSLSLAVFVIEILLKFAAPQIIEKIRPSYPDIEPVFIGLYVLSGLIVLRFNFAEINHRKSERAFTEAVWLLLNKENNRVAIMDIQEKLQLIHHAFKNHKVTRVSVWKKIGEDLVVGDGHWYPINDIPLRRLERGAGLASLVFEDKLTRYVPRLYFPFNKRIFRPLSFQFFHALTFEIICSPNATIDVAGRKIAPNILVFPKGSDPDSLSSFVAVPLIQPMQNCCAGVLCLDFAGTDPLDHNAIKAVAAFGLLLAIQDVS